MPSPNKTDARLLEPRAPPTSTISGLCQSNPHYRLELLSRPYVVIVALGILLGPHVVRDLHHLHLMNTHCALITCLIWPRSLESNFPLHYNHLQHWVWPKTAAWHQGNRVIYLQVIPVYKIKLVQWTTLGGLGLVTSYALFWDPFSCLGAYRPHPEERWEGVLSR